MPVPRMDNVGIVVEDLQAAIDFFGALGLEVEGRALLEGPWVDRVVDMEDVLSEIVMLRTPDGQGVELTTFRRPGVVATEPMPPPPNALGMRRMMFEVTDIDDVVARLRAHGGEVLGEISQYDDVYRLCYVRGPEGLLIGIAERLE